MAVRKRYITPIPGYEKGWHKHPLYVRWQGIKDRCLYPSHVAYERYGGAGVTICDRWLDFGLFVSDMGLPPTPVHTVERILNQYGYEPGNCKWATPAEQSRNTNRNHYIQHGGMRLTVRDWEIFHGVNKGTYQRRSDLGWTDEQIVTIEVKSRK